LNGGIVRAVKDICYGVCKVDRFKQFQFRGISFFDSNVGIYNVSKYASYSETNYRATAQKKYKM